MDNLSLVSICIPSTWETVDSEQDTGDGNGTAEDRAGLYRIRGCCSYLSSGRPGTASTRCTSRIGSVGTRTQTALREPALSQSLRVTQWLLFPGVHLPWTPLLFWFESFSFSVLGTKQKVCFSQLHDMSESVKVIPDPDTDERQLLHKASVSLPRRGDLPHNSRTSMSQSYATVHHTQS